MGTIPKALKCPDFCIKLSAFVYRSVAIGSLAIMHIQ